MPTNFPGASDSYTTKVDNVDAVAASHVNNLQDAIVALETKLGIDSSSVATCIDYFLKHSSGGYRTHKHDGTSDDGSSSIGALTAITVANDVDIGNYQLRALKFYSDQTTGTAPFAVESTTVVTNLNADKVDGYDSSSFFALVPSGSIIMWLTDVAPTGYLFCSGQEVSRTTYSDLFAVIGTTFGSGDGSTTFNIPNLKGRVPVGKDAGQTEFDTLGETGGAKEVTLTAAQSGLPSHHHTVGFINNNDGGTGGIQRANATNDSTQDTSDTGGTSASSAHTNLQPYLVLNYIIKT